MPDHIELQSLVDTHERPFAVIDQDFTVVTVNHAFEQAFQTQRELIVGRKCHAVLHGRDRPCYQEGEECPYMHCYKSHEPCSCLHTHFDSGGRARWVRVNLYPLRGADGRVYVGEMLQEIAARDATDPPDELRPVGGSPLFLRAMEQLEHAARTDAHVLMIGETGTGKELAASFIHRHSRRRDQPFIAVDCTVVTESLFESELFGHERGAFTGSVGVKKGLFEVAGGGTLFLDEIGEATLAMQAKLLRVLETGEFRRVGGNQTIEARARVVCATNRHLLELVRAGQFREDLYYRIACFCIRIPPLRDRIEDLPLLCDAILDHLGRRSGHVHRLTPGAISYLSRYSFPGNIRELRNILQVASTHSLHSAGGIITRDRIAQCMRMRDEFESTHSIGPRACEYEICSDGEPTDYGMDKGWAGVTTAPRAVAELLGRAASPAPTQDETGSTSLQHLEVSHIAELLKRYAGNRKQVAEALGISERTLYRKLKRYGLSDLR